MSSMAKLLSSSVRHGRPFSGVGILVRKNFLSKFKCVARRERFIAVFVGNVLLLNVYFPVNTGSAGYSEKLRCVLADMMSVINDCEATYVIVGGDFNFNFELDDKDRTLFDVVTGNNLVTCDDLLECDDRSLTHPVTFRHNVAHSGTFIGHFCVTRNLFKSISHTRFLDLEAIDHIETVLWAWTASTGEQSHWKACVQNSSSRTPVQFSSVQFVCCEHGLSVLTL